MSIPGLEAIGSSFTSQASQLANQTAGAAMNGASVGTTAAGSAAPSATGYLSPSAIRPSESAFQTTLTNAVDNLQNLQNTSNDLAVKAVTGDLDDIHDYTIAASEAQVTLELTAAVRNKAVDAFNEIMRMQV